MGVNASPRERHRTARCDRPCSCLNAVEVVAEIPD